MLEALDPLKYDVKIMLWFLLVIVLILVGIVYFPREHFEVFGREVMNISLPPFSEDTCKPGHENDAGLCYPKCRNGYRGVGPVCWAISENVGIGTVIGLENCPDGWFTEGLICREPITGGCTTHCDGNWSWSDGGFCHTRCEPLRGGRLKGRLDGGGVCPGPQPEGSKHFDRVDGMCYARCPEKLPKHMPGMPYLCYVGGELAYGRGVGKVPKLVRIAGKYPLIGPD